MHAKQAHQSGAFKSMRPARRLFRVSNRVAKILSGEETASLIVDYVATSVQVNQTGNSADFISLDHRSTIWFVFIELLKLNISKFRHSFGCVKHGREFSARPSPVGVKLNYLFHFRCWCGRLRIRSPCARHAHRDLMRRSCTLQMRVC